MHFSEYSEKLLEKWTRKALIYKGFQRQGVEMKVAPFRALTQLNKINWFHKCRNVEMKVAPFRALTHERAFSLLPMYHGRNEGCPFQGIDTSSSIVNEFTITSVEMKVAPFRALILI